MPQSASLLPSDNGYSLRSPESLAFEEAWEFARQGRDVPLRGAIDLKRFARFARWFAIIEPDPKAELLPLRLVGSGFFDLFKADLTGTDYLSLADPAIRRDAYASVMACLDRPCGLWQCTPAEIMEGGAKIYEYTILPISKDGLRADHIAIYVNFDLKPSGPKPQVERVMHSTVWHWLDIGFGVPDLSFS